MRLLPVIAVLVLAGCGTESGPSVPRPGSELLPAEVVAFAASGANTDIEVVEISDEPILWPEYAGRWGDEYSEKEPVADEPGMTYLAVAASTGCRVPLDVRVTRTGPSLSVEFTGGSEPETCAAPYAPSVLLALRSTDVEGVRSVNGLAPAEATGPGELIAFVPLGAGLDLDASGSELRLDPLYTSLEAAGANNLAEAKAALETDVPDDFLGLAFVLAGCAETSAVLVIDKPLRADLTGGENTNCDAPEYFLATFEVPAEYVPEGAVPGER
jgi:hypothetical protein